MISPATLPFAPHLVSEVAERQTTHNVDLAAPREVSHPTGNDCLGSRLQQYAKVWHNLHVHPRVVGLLNEGYLLPFKIRPKLSKIPLILSHYRNAHKEKILTDTVQDLLQKGAITKVLDPITPGFYSRVFLVPKPNQKWRPVIDLSLLNHHLIVTKFKMETAEIIRKSLKKGEWVTSIDIKDAYLHVPIHKKAQKYLRFQTKQGVYQFVSLPFGIATAPHEFTLLAKEVKLLARSRGLKMHQYLDDWLLRSDSREKSVQDTQRLLNLVQSLGWLVNFDKSELTPSQRLDFLGYHFDLEKGLVFPTSKSLEKLALIVASLKRNLYISARSLMSLIGLLVSLEKTVPLGRLHIRPFQWHLKNHWKWPQSLDKIIPVTTGLLKHLKWWESPQNLMRGSPLHHIEHTVSLLQILQTKVRELTWGTRRSKVSGPIKRNSSISIF